MISLSVRSFAELIHLPAYEQERILYEQKYPNREPQKFKVPYYQQALKGIRSYYAAGNDPRALAAARTKAASLNHPVRRNQNIRVLDNFQRSRQSKRPLRPLPLAPLSAQPFAGVQLRLMFDLQAYEENQPRRLFYNLRDAPIEHVVATTTLQIAFWVITENELAVPIGALQFVDLKSGKVYSISRQSDKTIRLMRANARIVATLWPAI